MSVGLSTRIVEKAQDVIVILFGPVLQIPEIEKIIRFFSNICQHFQHLLRIVFVLFLSIKMYSTIPENL